MRCGRRLITRLMPSLLAFAVAGVDERGDLGPPAVDDGSEVTDFGESESAHQVRNPTCWRSAPVRARARRLRRFSLAIHAVSSVFPISPSPRRGVPHGGELVVGEILAVAREPSSGPPLRVGGASTSAPDPAVVRRLTMESILLASWTTWKWSTTTIACGRPVRTAAR